MKDKMKKNRQDPKITKELKNKTILITGGAGSIGSLLTKKILQYPVHSVRILDINEHALFLLKREISDKRLRLLLGDIKDSERVEIAGNGTDIIFHAAAIKNIEISEFNPIETINTNVNGTTNLIKMAIKNQPSKFVNISTDKAVEPTTLYGTTKQLSEKLTTWAGAISQNTKFGTIRFANVFESRGNVFEIWNEESNQNLPLSITHHLMKRYFFHADDAVNFILKCLPMINKGKIFVPKMKSYNIKNLASKISKKQKIIGLRKGEKLEEILLSKDEQKRSKNLKDMWIINPFQIKSNYSQKIPI